MPGSPVTVAGWVLDTTALPSVSVLIDGNEAATAPVSSARPDVCAVYPNYAGCPTPANMSATASVGFAAQVDTTSLSPCPHLVSITATDQDGNTTVLGERVIAPE